MRSAEQDAGIFYTDGPATLADQRYLASVERLQRESGDPAQADRAIAAHAEPDGLSATRVIRHHLSYRAPIVIDARMKPWYPRELTCRADVAAQVTARWREYFPARSIEMGDSEQGHLD